MKRTGGKVSEGPRERVATIRDVAAAAGVSLSTASNALRGLGKLRPATVERVKAAAAQLEYRPNALMQSLLRGRSSTVGLISREPTARFSLPFLTGVEDELAASQVSVFLCFSAKSNPDRERQHVESLLAKQVDGIIVFDEQYVDGPSDARRLITVGNAGTPVIYAYHHLADPTVLCLVPDHAQGARLATQHLIQTGRRRLAHVTGPEMFEAVSLRRNAMREVMDEHGLALPEDLVLVGDTWDPRWGRRAARHLLDIQASIDAIFCASDTIAAGVMSVLQSRGVRIPDDIAIVGFDNWSLFTQDLEPALTSVDQQLHELGRRSGHAMLAMINGEPERGILHLPCRLVVRESSGVPANLG